MLFTSLIACQSEMMRDARLKSTLIGLSHHSIYWFSSFSEAFAKEKAKWWLEAHMRAQQVMHV